MTRKFGRFTVEIVDGEKPIEPVVMELWANYINSRIGKKAVQVRANGNSQASTALN